MKISWIFFTVLLLAAFLYLGRRQSGLISAVPRSAAQQSPSRTPAGSHRLADSMQAKLDYIQQNGQKAHPDQRPTVITEEEVNDYLASGRVQLPQGVNKVRLEGQSGHVNANLNVDFDKIREGQRSSNPLLGLFSGIWWTRDRQRTQREPGWDRNSADGARVLCGEIHHTEIPERRHGFQVPVASQD